MSEDRDFGLSQLLTLLPLIILAMAAGFAGWEWLAMHWPFGLWVTLSPIAVIYMAGLILARREAVRVKREGGSDQDAAAAGLLAWLFSPVGVPYAALWVVMGWVGKLMAFGYDHEPSENRESFGPTVDEEDDDDDVWEGPIEGIPRPPYRHSRRKPRGVSDDDIA